MKYVPALDGIRAIAIIAVFVFHVSPSWIPGGFTGVDIFFVLSGFLITTKILGDLHRGDFSFKTFYLNRAKRLLPNATVMTLVVCVVWQVFMSTSMYKATSTHGLWSMFSASNFYVLLHLGGYWGNSAEWAPLTHTWSLGIEEQFYLLYPCCLYLLNRWLPKYLRPLILLFTVASFAACVIGTFSHPTATFYLLPTRVWELLLGGLLSVFTPNVASDDVVPERRNTIGLIGLVGVIVVSVGFYTITDGRQFPGWLSLAPTVGTVLIIISVIDEQSRISKVLSLKPLVMIGRLSYSLYLWHWPLITMGKHQAKLLGHPILWGSICGAAVSILLSVCMYFLVEKPIRRKSLIGGSAMITFVGLFTLVVCYLISGAVKKPVADPDNRFDPVKFNGTAYDVTSIACGEHNTAVQYYDVLFEPHAKRTWKQGGLLKQYGTSNPKVVVLGSSHALMYSRLIDDICQELKTTVAFFGVDGSAPALFDNSMSENISGPFVSKQESRQYDIVRKRFLALWKPDVVFVIDRWDTRYGNSTNFESSMRVFMKDIPLKDTQVIFVSQVPVHDVGEHVNLREYVTFRFSKSNVYPTMLPDSLDSTRLSIATNAEALSTEISSLTVLRPDKLFYNDDLSIRYVSGRKFFYADDDHLSEDGSEITRSLFLRTIKLYLNR
jgi:peptidoglycan/LPS O-acetylase OafA/YrhL